MLATVGGFVTISRAKVFIVVSLIATWFIAHLFPNYQPIIQDRIAEQLGRTRKKLPSIKIDFHPNRDPRTAYNSSKLALLIEARPIPHLVPQLLHMISVVPPDWRFLFIGSNESVIAVGRSFATQYQQVSGKLDLMVPPEPWSIESKEHVFRMLTDIRFYEELLPGVEWILKYEADSILCANSDDSLNDWLDYDWAGAPRVADDRFAGNGGLSLRRVSAIRRVLKFQARYNDSLPEDQWFGQRVVNIPGLKVASGGEENHFSVEEVWHERPMGYHLLKVDGKLTEGIWKKKENRHKIFEYCPELSLIMDMKLERERCEGDNGEGELAQMPAVERKSVLMSKS